MVMAPFKSPSQLWQEASPEDRQRLEDCLKQLHRLWQDSDHYTDQTPMGRVPRAISSRNLDVICKDLRWIV